MRIKSVVLLFLIALISVSCASVVEKPKISLDDIQLERLSLRQSSAVIKLNVENPNAFPIFLSGIDYGLRLNDIDVANGSNDNRVTIPSSSKEVVEIPINLKTSTIFKLIPAALKNKQLRYDLTGKVKTPFINLPFNRTGGVGVFER